jgi:carboxyl-terminal processing protease
MLDPQTNNIKLQKKFPWGKFFLYYLLILAVAAGFIVGFFYGKRGAEKLADAQTRVSEEEFVSGEVIGKNTKPKFLTNDVDFDLYWDVWRRVSDNYINKPVSETELLYGSLAGMVDAVGDPYTVFFNPEIAFRFQQELEGSFEGIGAEIGIKHDRLTIIAPLPDTPAEKAGLRHGDQVYFIDDVDTSTISLDEAVGLIRGPKGSVVTLKIWRGGNGEELISVPITRSKINVSSVEWKMVENDLTAKNDSSIAYIKIRHFNEDTNNTLNKITPAILQNKPDGIILDLRNNPGGFLNQSIGVSSKWIENNVVVKEKGSSGEVNTYNSFGKPSFKGIKTVILINGGSASASEIVSGALQDYGLATIIGQTSFGKGSVQDYQELPDGSALKITVAEWLTPKDRSIDGNGITPDIEVELTDEDYSEDRDPQLERAIEFFITGE